jgi:hypothetical protein
MASRPDDDILRGKRSGATVEDGVDVPMCFCGDHCKAVHCEQLGDFYGMRWFMCANYAYDKPRAIGYERPKVVDNTQL